MLNKFEIIDETTCMLVVASKRIGHVFVKLDNIPPLIEILDTERWYIGGNMGEEPWCFKTKAKTSAIMLRRVLGLAYTPLGQVFKSAKVINTSDSLNYQKKNLSISTGSSCHLFIQCAITEKIMAYGINEHDKLNKK